MSAENYWTLIPAFIYQFKELNATDREVYGAVNGLSSKRGYCTASSKYISERINISVATVKRCLAKLNKLNLIMILTEPYNGAIQKRKIFTARVNLDDGAQNDPRMAQNEPRNEAQNEPQQGDYTNRITGRETPTNFYINLERIKLTQNQFKKFSVQRFHGNTKDCKQFLEEMDMTMRGKGIFIPTGGDPGAYCENWFVNNEKFKGRFGLGQHGEANRKDKTGTSNKARTKAAKETEIKINQMAEESAKVTPEMRAEQIAAGRAKLKAKKQKGVNEKKAQAKKLYVSSGDK